VTLLQAIILSLLQGASELFPVSSLGHTIVLPTLLGWHIDLSSDGPFLPFVVTLHLGTALALILFYWRDWRKLIVAFFKSLAGGKEDADAKIAWLLLIGTIPCAALGFIFEKPLRHLFGSPLNAAIFLLINGVLMIAGEHVRRGADIAPAKEEEQKTTGARKPLDELAWWQALGVGFAESLALFPGISRSGATIVAGLLCRLTHEDAFRYANLLATPIILAAGILEVPQLGQGAIRTPNIGLYAAMGFVLAGITAWLSVKFLTKYFETKRLDPFGYYCILLGAVTLAVLHFHH
jgi:undecaprenyl-diphosphatase